MAHHSSKNMSDDLKKLFNDAIAPEPKNPFHKEMANFAEAQNLGKTNNFPEGRLDGTDEGEIAFAVGQVDGKIILNFGKPVTWVGMTAEQARELGTLLIRKSSEILSV